MVDMGGGETALVMSASRWDDKGKLVTAICLFN